MKAVIRVLNSSMVAILSLLFCKFGILAVLWLFPVFHDLGGVWAQIVFVLLLAVACLGAYLITKWQHEFMRNKSFFLNGFSTCVLLVTLLFLLTVPKVFYFIA